DSGIMYHDLYLGGKALAEKENVGLDLTKSDLYPSFVEELTAKGMGLRVADSHTGNHHEDDFTPPETIQRFLDSIIPVGCPGLLSKDNRWDTKSFGDKLPDKIYENPFFQCLGRYPTSVRVFPDHILFMAGQKPSWENGQQRPIIIVGRQEMAFRNFMYAETDEDLSFLTKKPSLDFGTGSSSVSINTEPPVATMEPAGQLVENTTDFGGSPHREMIVIHLGSVAGRIKERKCKTRGGSLRPPVKRLPDVLELQNANAYHLKISAITPTAWKGHFDNQLDLELLDLHDCYYARQAVKVRDQECEELKVKCEMAMTKFDKNLAVIVLHEKISALLGEVSLWPLESKVASLEAEKVKLEAAEASPRQELEKSKLDRAEVVSKVVPYVAIELVPSDNMGKLVAKLVSSSIFYGRCQAFEEVANMKDPFDLTKVKGYRPSYKQEHTKAGNEFVTATFPYLADVVADPYASIESLLSKKPWILQRPVPTRTHVPAFSAPSQKATPSSALASQ
ncbi:hypothetical protein Tco_0739711, partial [Tanacetum coccineum]